MEHEKKYRIGEVAEMLKLKSSVLRYWESEFTQLIPHRTDKGQRYYSEEEVVLLRRIKQLLHEQGMTIDGAKRILNGTAIYDKNQPGLAVAVPDPAFMSMLLAELTAIKQLLTTPSH